MKPLNIDLETCSVRHMGRPLLALAALAAGLIGVSTIVMEPDLLPASVASAARAEWQPTQGLPPDEMLLPGATVPLVLASADYDCEADRLTYTQSILISWKHEATGQWFRQNIPTSYYPTAICRGQDPLTLCVAGKRPRGNTCIEVWQLDEPEARYVIDVSTGEEELIVEFAPRVSIETLYDDAIEEMDIVQSMQLQQGGAHRVLVDFLGSSRLYDFSTDPNGPAPELVASATPPPAGSTALHIPELDGFYPLIQRFHHVSHGYVMSLRTISGDGPSLELYDPDKDLVFDGYDVVMTTADWVATGLSDSRNHLPLE